MLAGPRQGSTSWCYRLETLTRVDLSNRTLLDSDGNGVRSSSVQYLAPPPEQLQRALACLEIASPWPLAAWALEDVENLQGRSHLTLHFLALETVVGAEYVVARLEIDLAEDGGIRQAWLDPVSPRSLSAEQACLIRNATRLQWPVLEPGQCGPEQSLMTLNLTGTFSPERLNDWPELPDFRFSLHEPVATAVFFAASTRADPPWLALQLFTEEELDADSGHKATLVIYGLGREGAPPTDYDVIVTIPEPLLHGEELRRASIRPRSRGRLSERVGTPAFLRDGVLEIRDQSDAVLEYVDDEYVWLRHKIFGWRNIRPWSEVKEIRDVRAASQPDGRPRRLLDDGEYQAIFLKSTLEKDADKADTLWQRIRERYPQEPVPVARCALHRLSRYDGTDPTVYRQILAELILAERLSEHPEDEVFMKLEPTEQLELARAMCYWQLGHAERALCHVDNMLRMAPGSDLARKTRQFFEQNNPPRPPVQLEPDNERSQTSRRDKAGSRAWTLGAGMTILAGILWFAVGAQPRSPISSAAMGLPASALRPAVRLERACNLRPAPNIANSPLTAIQQGTRCTQLEISGRWLRVECSPNGTTGWISQVCIAHR